MASGPQSGSGGSGGVKSEQGDGLGSEAGGQQEQPEQRAVEQPAGTDEREGERDGDGEGGAGQAQADLHSNTTVQ